MGKKSDAFLLSDGDRLRLSSKTALLFRTASQSSTQDFDVIQERDMQAISDRYVVTDRMVGSGAFGKVFMAIEQHTRTQLACKIVDLRRTGPKAKQRTSFAAPQKAGEHNMNTELQKIAIWGDQKKRELDIESKLSTYFRECEMLCSFNHPNIIVVDKVLVTNSSLYIFQDLATAGNLHTYLNANNNNLTEVESATLIWQLLVAVQYLHERNIAHRNLRPENILVTGCTTGVRILLTSFGSARQIAQVRKPNIVTDMGQTSSPGKGTNVSSIFAKDMWCVGVISALLLLGTLPEDDVRIDGLGLHLKSRMASKPVEQLSRWKYLSEDSKRFVRDLLVLKDDDRMSVNEAIRNPWFSNSPLQINHKELYQKAVSNWRPRLSSVPVIEFVKGKSNTIRNMKCSKQVIDHETQLRETSRPRNIPLDPPYKPFPRKMHEQGGLWPKRSKRAQGMSEEIKEVIKRDWSPASIEKSDLPDRNTSTGPVKFKTPPRPAREAFTIPKQRHAMRTLQRSASWSMDLHFLTQASLPTPPTSAKAQNGTYHGVTSSPSEGLAKSGSQEKEGYSRTPFRRINVLSLPSSKLGVREVDRLIPNTSPEKKAPVPLNVRSQSKLLSRPRSRSTSGSLKGLSSSPVPKTFKGSVYDHETEPEKGVTSGRVKSKAPSGKREEFHNVVLRSKTNEAYSGVWIHEEWLRLTEEDVE